MTRRMMLLFAIVAVAPTVGAVELDGLPTTVEVSPQQSCGATAHDDPDGTSHHTTTCFTGVHLIVADAPARVGREDVCARSTDPGEDGEPSTRIETCRSGVVVSTSSGSRLFVGTQDIVVERCDDTSCNGAATTDLLLEARLLSGGPFLRFTHPLPVALLP